MKVNLPKKWVIETQLLLHEWEEFKEKQLDRYFWEKFIEKHKDIFNYTKVSRLFSSTTNKEYVKSVIDVFINRLFNEEGCDEICKIDFSTFRGTSQFLRKATGWRVKDYPKWIASSRKHFNWSIVLFLILLSKFTRKRGTAMKVMEDLIKGYKKYNRGKGKIH